MELDPSQQAAVELMLSSPFTIVTGGPGTGKSTTLRVALDRMDERGESYALAAPTGKASKRMQEATGRPASTIHRLLCWTPQGFMFNEGNQLDVDAVIIDESSMLDIELARDLLSAVSVDTRVILVGDANQLPSVGPGRVLADLVESNVVPVARLTTVHRAAAESWVCSQAPNILAGKPLDLSPRHDFRFVEAEDPADAARHVADLVSSEAYKGAQVLAPQRNTACGVEALNAALQARLNPKKHEDQPEWKMGDSAFRRGDRVIQTSNNYKLVCSDGSMGVFNGEVGEIVELSSNVMIVDFGDRKVEYTREAAMGLDLAYALTVHKSQGSEFPWVICVVHSSHTHMLTRQLVYTAITRAKKGVVIVGNRKGLAVATSDKVPPKRNTGLVARMKEIAGETKVEELVERDIKHLKYQSESPAVEDEIPW